VHALINVFGLDYIWLGARRRLGLRLREAGINCLTFMPKLIISRAPLEVCALLITIWSASLLCSLVKGVMNNVLLISIFRARTHTISEIKIKSNLAGDVF